MGLGEIMRYTLSCLRTSDRTLVEALVGLAVLPRSESSTLHLLAVTTAGVCVCVCVCACVCVCVCVCV